MPPHIHFVSHWKGLHYKCEFYKKTPLSKSDKESAMPVGSIYLNKNPTRRRRGIRIKSAKNFTGEIRDNKALTNVRSLFKGFSATAEMWREVWNQGINSKTIPRCINGSFQNSLLELKRFQLYFAFGNWCSLRRGSAPLVCSNHE